MTAPAPVLALSELTAQHDWEPLRLPAHVHDDYRELTGWDRPELPAGLGVVVARRAFTRGRPLPPGGVLLGIEFDNHGVPPADGAYEFKVSTDVSRDSAGRTLARVSTRLRRPRGERVADVTFVLRWPDA